MGPPRAPAVATGARRDHPPPPGREQVAAGRSADDVLESVRRELTQLLSLQSCDFEPPPFGVPLPRLERNGCDRHPRTDGSRAR